MTPSTAGGVVQFFDGTTALGSPVTVASGTASIVITPAAGDHSYTAEFVPNDAEAAIIGGSTSNTVPYTVFTPTVTVTKFSPTRLGQGASNIGVTLTGTEFVAGATVSVPGISFSSVSVVNSTTITAKAKVGSSAKVGAANCHRHRLGGLGFVHHLPHHRRRPHREVDHAAVTDRSVEVGDDHGHRLRERSDRHRSH